MNFKVFLSSFLFKQSGIEENIMQVEDSVKMAYKKHCQLICFPECALTGLPTEDYKKNISLAIKIPGKLTGRIGAIAKRYRIYIAIGILEKEKEKIYDSALLFSDMGEIILKYRRINPQWHSRRVPKDLYVEGKDLPSCLTPFGKLAFAICGDIFDNSVVKILKKEKFDYLIVPMSRSFGGSCNNKKDWERKEKFVYARQIAKTGVTTFLVNAFEPIPGGSFGGTLIIAKDGKIIAETEIGRATHLYKFIHSYLRKA